MSDDAEARRERSNRLRAQIRRITGKSPDAPDQPEAGTAGGDAEPPPVSPAGASGARPPSPNDFIERRMRELDRGTSGDGKNRKG
jgi:hypothetical protein